MTKMKTETAPRHSGFTLVELMVAAAASVILIGVVMSSLITFQGMSQGLDDRLKQEAEIQRALRFIAADIQEGNLIRLGAPERSGYSPVFEITRPDNSFIGYYTKSRGSLVWAGPQIIYRKDSRDEDIYALVDQISAEPTSGCRTNPGDDSGVGLRVLINSKSKATICIRGDVAGSPNDVEQSIQAATRVASP